MSLNLRMGAMVGGVFGCMQPIGMMFCIRPRQNTLQLAAGRFIVLQPCCLCKRLC
jgi:hypothetical protein